MNDPRPSAMFQILMWVNSLHMDTITLSTAIYHCGASEVLGLEDENNCIKVGVLLKLFILSGYV